MSLEHLALCNGQIKIAFRDIEQEHMLSMTIKIYLGKNLKKNRNTYLNSFEFQLGIERDKERDKKRKR